MNNRCFICNIEKYIVEKSGIKFRNHVNEEHNLWNYVAFIMQLRSKTTKDCNTKESHILEHINMNDLSWIPHLRSSKLGFLLL